MRAVFHPECHGLSRRAAQHAKGPITCPQHSCCECLRSTASCGGMLFRCQTCPRALCEDCLPEGEIDAIGDTLPELCVHSHLLLLLRDYGAMNTAYYIRCDQCQERFKVDPEFCTQWEEEMRETQAELERRNVSFAIARALNARYEEDSKIDANRHKVGVSISAVADWTALIILMGSRVDIARLVLNGYALLAYVLLLTQWSGTVHAQGDSSLWTSWVPIAVRSPYLSAWMNTTDVPYNTTNVDGVARAPTVWPNFMQGQHASWAGLIRVDGDGNKTFMWLGDTDQPTGLHRGILTNIQITPTRTIMNLTAGPLNLIVTFLSPIEPSNPALQSLPFSYLSLDITSNDGQAHAVQVYTDITGEWASGDPTNTIKWMNQTTDTIVYHNISRQIPQELAEHAGQAEDATVFYATSRVPNQSACTNDYPICRGQFQQLGSLSSTPSIEGPASISGAFPVFAMAVDLGTISATSSPVMWALGMVRDPAVLYTGFGAIDQYCRPYWSSQFETAVDAVTYFIQDFADASDRATALDQKMLNDAAAVSTHYADLVSLAARQAVGGTELTIGTSGASSINSNTSGVKMFMKDIVGETVGRVNAVEGLYAAFPFFLYLNATYGGYLLEPVLEYANTSSWTPANLYAPRDIGADYPNATSTQSHDEGVEQSSNMLVMSLAHARATGDGSLINGYYPLLKLWATYLVNNSLPSYQLSVDSSSERNLTNLALKGIVGIKAMSEISTALHIDSDAQYFNNASTALAKQWQSQALSSASQHILTSFGDPDTSWSLSYNLFADRLLNTTVVPSSVYQSQTSFLKSVISSSNNGVPIDTDADLSGEANTVWSLFAAAYVDDPSVAEGLVDQIWGFMSSNTSANVGIFPTYYNISTASSVGNINSPSVGGIFAPLSLKVPSITISVPADNSNSPPAAPSKKSNSVGAIVGGVVGGVGGAAVVLFAGLWCYRKRRHTRKLAEKDADLDAEPAPFVYEATPFESRQDPSAVNTTSGTYPAQAYSKAREALLNTEGYSALSPSVSASVLTDASSSGLASSAPSEMLAGPSSATSSGPASRWRITFGRPGPARGNAAFEAGNAVAARGAV
ncbi:hypothetical protein NM688_g6428 [Phlebia brevispora]|uniref:Uncharacterized protein n=1 Tax=Phlebia brevispora TaxID=194682 RepID=A0ACC1SG55_9APHY|nr:hypothetical protein NM688_g6428 [Phlebia brevispora]